MRNFTDTLCGRCHSFGSPDSTVSTGGRSHFHRRPSSSQQLAVTVGMAGAHTDADHWIVGQGSGFEQDGSRVLRVPFATRAAAGYSAASSVSADNEVFCLSCHTAHGSVHAFGMIWPYGHADSPISAAGCNQCHNVSGS